MCFVLDHFTYINQLLMLMYGHSIVSCQHTVPASYYYSALSLLTTCARSLLSLSLSVDCTVMGGTKGSKGKRQQGKSPAQRAAHVATVAQELADDASKRAAQLEEATEEEQQQQEEQEEQKEEEEEVEETEEERKAEEPKKRARPVPLSSQPQQRSAPLSAPPPHKKPKLQKGDQVPRGATNPIFIAIEHRQHLEYYYSIANKLTRARKAGNNEDWKEEIEHKFDVSSTLLEDYLKTVCRL